MEAPLRELFVALPLMDRVSFVASQRDLSGNLDFQRGNLHNAIEVPTYAQCIWPRAITVTRLMRDSIASLVTMFLTVSACVDIALVPN